MPNLIEELLKQRSRVWKFKPIKKFNFLKKLSEARFKSQKKDLTEWERLRAKYRYGRK